MMMMKSGKPEKMLFEFEQSPYVGSTVIVDAQVKVVITRKANQVHYHPLLSSLRQA